jgi:hypothetical protein
MNRENTTVQPAPEAPTSLEDQFNELATIWRSETAHFSSARRMASHPAYQAIIALGKSAVPLLLRELEKEPGHWFLALEAITGANPISNEDRGRVDRMAQAWLRWGSDHGYRW